MGHNLSLDKLANFPPRMDDGSAKWAEEQWGKWAARLTAAQQRPDRDSEIVAECEVQRLYWKRLAWERMMSESWADQSKFMEQVLGKQKAETGKPG